MPIIRRFLRLLAVALLGSVAGPFGLGQLHAQTADYFRALTVPPRAVGTCMSVDSTRVGDVSPLRLIRLVMVSLPPGSRREMMISVDRKDRVVRYADLIGVSPTPGATDGDDILAAIDAQGQVHGLRLRSTSRLPGPVSRKTSATELQSMMKHMIRTEQRDTLDGSAQRQVLQLAKWLHGRCPG